MKQFLVLLFFLVFFVQGISQNDTYRFNRITDQTSLSQAWVRCCYQDDIGFIWVGTSNGINRYDGHEFKKFFADQNLDINFGNITINAITKKSDNEFWIATDIGVYYYNYINETLHSFSKLKRHAILGIVEDNNQNIWFSSNIGLYKYTPTDSCIIKYTHNPENPLSLSNNYVNIVFKDSENNIWIGTKQGLNLYDETNESFIRNLLPGEKSGKSNRDILTICEDNNRKMWFGTARNGIYITENSLDDIKNPSYRKIMDGLIIDIHLDSRNYLWIGHGSGKGLDIVSLNSISDYKQLNINHLEKIPDNQTSLSDNSIYNIFEDKNGDIWIGTFGGGLNYYSPRSKKFKVVEENITNKNSIKNNLVNAFLEEEDFLWIGTEGGLDRYDKKTGKYTHFEHDNNDSSSLGANPIFALYKDSRENLWVGTWAGGLNLYNYKTESFKRFLPDETFESISNANVFSIVEDSRGNLWIGTIGGGLNRYDYETGIFTHYLNDPTNPNSISNDEINHIRESDDGKLLISAYYALEEFDYQNNNFKHIVNYADKSDKFNSTYILSTFEDSNKNTWLATNLGLNVIDSTGKIKIHYSQEDGLPDNTIQGLLEDDNGNLWLSTHKGLAQFINAIHLPKKPKFNNFTITDGLSGNEFKKRAAFKNKEGLMYFGTSKGFTSFYPDSISFNTIKPRTILTDMYVLRQSKTEEGRKEYVQITDNLNYTPQIELSYSNSDFIINYASLSYLNPKNNQYQYKLEGYDNNWKSVGNQQSATYTNINPGQYTFTVQGSNNDGLWSEYAKSLKIIIHPPWWKTFGFKILLVATALLLVYLLLRLHSSQQEKQKQLLRQKVEERTSELYEKNILLKRNQERIAIQNEELSTHRNNLEELVKNRTIELEKAKLNAEKSDRLKSAFLANMSHEIRTPLNAIVGFSSLLKEDSITPEDMEQYIHIIDSNSESLMVLINDILDISLIEANQLKLNKKHFNIYPVFAAIESVFNLKNTKDITFEFVNKSEKEEIILYNDSVRFSQVINNLISNAYKYSDKGTIRFGYELLKNKIRFFFADTGIGIEQADQEYIFNHFFKIESENSRIYGGIGIGLAITKKLVNLMGGDIHLESEVNVGSTFYFDLPLDESI